MRIPHRFNRLLLYSANLIHNAGAYRGRVLADKRMAATLCRMAGGGW